MGGVGGDFGTECQAGFRLAGSALGGLGLDGWRGSLGGDYFQPRHGPAATPSPMNEDGHAAPLALSWQGVDWLRVAGEALLMDSRKGQYKTVGIPSGALSQNQFQLDAKFFF